MTRKDWKKWRIQFYAPDGTPKDSVEHVSKITPTRWVTQCLVLGKGETYTIFEITCEELALVTDTYHKGARIVHGNTSYGSNELLSRS